MFMFVAISHVSFFHHVFAPDHSSIEKVSKKGAHDHCTWCIAAHDTLALNTFEYRVFRDVHEGITEDYSTSRLGIPRKQTYFLRGPPTSFLI